MTTVAPTPVSRAERSAPVLRLSFGRVLRSEWIKFASLRSTWWSLAIAAVLTIGIALMIASASRGFGDGYTAVSAIVAPTQFTMLVAGILGAIAITGEYSTGMIRSTLTAEPRRGAVLLAKAVVITVVMAVSTALMLAIALIVTAPVFGADGVDWSDPAYSTVPLLFTVLSMVAFSLIGLAAGFLIRNGAGAIAATVGVLFVLPIVTSMFAMAGDGWRWVLDAAAHLPMMAAQTVTTPGTADLTQGTIDLLAWPLVGLIAAWLLLRVRDA